MFRVLLGRKTNLTPFGAFGRPPLSDALSKAWTHSRSSGFRSNKQRNFKALKKPIWSSIGSKRYHSQGIRYDDEYFKSSRPTTEKPPSEHQQADVCTDMVPIATPFEKHTTPVSPGLELIEEIWDYLKNNPTSRMWIAYFLSMAISSILNFPEFLLFAWFPSVMAGFYFYTSIAGFIAAILFILWSLKDLNKYYR